MCAIWRRCRARPWRGGFGADLLRRLDQAMGDLPEPVAPPPAPPVIAVRMSLPDPIGLLGDLQAGLARLLDRLCQHLHRAELGARRLVLELSRVDGQSVRLEIRLARPMRDADGMAPLFDRALDGVDAGYGIDGMRLSAPETDALPLQQVTTGGAQAQDDLSDLLTRLSNRLGFEHVQRLLPADSHIPEKAFTVAAAAYSDPAPTGRAHAPAPADSCFRPNPSRAAGARCRAGSSGGGNGGRWWRPAGRNALPPNGGWTTRTGGRACATTGGCRPTGARGCGCFTRRSATAGAFRANSPDPFVLPELDGIKPRIGPALRQKRIMRALFDHAAPVHDHDLVGAAHGGQAMRDHQRRAALRQTVQRGLHQRFGFRIERACRLVQQQDRRVAQQRAGNRHALALPARQR